jgi:hypothetical protein
MNILKYARLYLVVFCSAVIFLPVGAAQQCGFEKPKRDKTKIFRLGRILAAERCVIANRKDK